MIDAFKNAMDDQAYQDFIANSSLHIMYGHSTTSKRVAMFKSLCGGCGAGAAFCLCRSKCI